MRAKLSKLLITGGAGFIGSALVRQAVKKGYRVVVVDKLTYAGDLRRLGEVGKKIRLYRTDIGNLKQMQLICKKEKPAVIVNCAAETHVDRSIRDARSFIDANIKGVQVLLDLARQFPLRRFVQISTDEVYGDIARGSFTEGSPLKASSPYAASKAAADLLIQSYVRTHGSPVIIIRPCNNYGPWQYPEKLLPRAILRVLRGEKIPVYGKGLNVREWLYVDDCAAGILFLMSRGRNGEVYNLGSGVESRNIDTVRMLLRALGVSDTMFEFVKDRPGHDIRYSLNCHKIRRQFKWKPKVTLPEGLALTVNWCLHNQEWLLSKWEEVSRLYNE